VTGYSFYSMVPGDQAHLESILHIPDPQFKVYLLDILANLILCSASS